ncbi:PhnD/SsuA/transferrin family substrate-binding protein [Schlesneria paludicola]|uniref:PhnD/SsuA/transferrin family substrate-binding protein n=1 Tax=Schlesneria paludicola TaxID=360056 RepID=UPI00029AF5A4|nr:PhnD/SsuA/transferrin family substrate-binding protein [Schlesneria paludicola]
MKHCLTIALTMMAIASSALCDDATRTPLTVVVMDPLSAPLACDCVKGYAQRKYEKLGEFLQDKLNRPVRVYWAESLATAMEEKTKGRADLIIGKHSVVLADAKESKLTVEPVAQLTGKDGKTTQTGLFIVRTPDKAKSMADLAGYRILFGPADCDEKSAAPMALLKKSGHAIPTPVETSPSCSDAAKALLELPATVNAAAVVSSYAQPLLEGCGSIKKGDVRVIGESAPVPFITAFVNTALSNQLKSEITSALLKVGEEASLLIALETEKGFVRYADPKDQTTSAVEQPDYSPLVGQAVLSGKEEWPQFRGPFRDGTVDWLPNRLPVTPKFEWTATLPSDGLGGLAVASNSVIVSGRDPLDQQDLWTCLDASSGRMRWKLTYQAPGRLDYGNSPRATPLIANDHAWLLGAFGHLHCVRLSDGQIVWKTSLNRQFGMPPLTWGLAGSPLIVEGRLIVQPGGPQASIVALNPMTGDVIWTTPGLPPGHASIVTTVQNGDRQLIGCDKESIGGWKASTGERLWTIVPHESGDFNVPSPIIHSSGFVVASENNGAREYSPRKDGQPGFEQVAHYATLSPDSHSPVVSGDRLIGIHNGLHCLSLTEGLTSIWRLKDRAFRNYGSLIASKDRILALTFHEELVLIDPHQAAPMVVSRLRLSDEGSDCWSHPALAHRALYVRLGRAVCRLNLDESAG